MWGELTAFGGTGTEQGKDEGTASKEGGVSGTKHSSGHGEEKAAAEADEAPRKSWFARWFGGDKDK